MKPYDHEGISWFDQVYPKFKVREGNDIKTLGEKLGMIEVLQKPGETIFVPGGWAHVVINLDLTVAVTQNFCSSTNAEYVYLQTRHSRPKLGAKLFREIQRLGQAEPQIYGNLAESLKMTKYIPQLPPSSSSDSSNSGNSSTSSSSSSSTSSDEDNTATKKRSRKRKIIVSSTDSETDLSNGTCMCKKCKIKRKKKLRLSRR
jgi:histone arginine demethylase JMJD6